MLPCWCHVTLLMFIGHTTAAEDKLDDAVTVYLPACQSHIRFIHFLSIDCNDQLISWLESYLANLWYCSKNEIGNLRSAVCNKEETASMTLAIKKLKAWLDPLSFECRFRNYVCILQSMIAIIFTRQDNVCSLMDLNINGSSFEACLTTGSQKCQSENFRFEREWFCRLTETDVDQTFSNGLLTISAVCQSQISNCASASRSAIHYVNSGNFCDFLTSTIESCFKTDNSCSSEECEIVKIAACGMENSARSKKIHFLFLSVVWICFFFVF
ncbi:hypothetical protein BgiMline_017688 [Biomphalaria glabrata]